MGRFDCVPGLRELGIAKKRKASMKSREVYFRLKVSSEQGWGEMRIPVENRAALCAPPLQPKLLTLIFEEDC